MRIVSEGGTDWAPAVEAATPGTWLTLDASWCALEPEKGRYDDAVLDSSRRALITARKRGVDPIVVVHRGGLPDWQIERDGWLDPDALAGFGCYVDRLAHHCGELARHWVGLWEPLGEAALYEAEQARVARTLLEAQASAWLHLRKAPGPRGGGTLVGIAERFDVAARRRDQLVGRLLGREAEPHALISVLSTGQLRPPFGAVGELPNGTPATDFTIAIRPTIGDLHHIWQHGRSVFVCAAGHVARQATEEGVNVLGVGGASLG